MLTNDKSSYVLAMYDIRGKQEYIYKSTKMKEIVGASWIIRDCFKDYLFPAAKEYSKNIGMEEKGIYTYKDDSTNEFNEEELKNHFDDGYLGEVVYDGGGNFLVIYRNKDVYKEINKIFTRDVMKATYSLRVLISCVGDLDFSDYKKDRDRLYAIHRINERKEFVSYPINTLPIVQVDYHTSMPLSKKITILGEYNEKSDSSEGVKKDSKGNVINIISKVSLESAAKYEKYSKIIKSHNCDGIDKDIQGAEVLDELIVGKGEDSHLAVIYIDGNNMGAQVQKCIEDNDRHLSYEEAVKNLRIFSSGIQKYYIDEPKEDIDKKLESYEGKSDGKRRRFLIYAGDEMTFVCNAKYAYDVVKTYFQSLEESYANNRSDFGENKPSSCAGIAIFKSHSPYADAYRIAEECCETGKQLMKKYGMKTACFMDFHYCQGAIGTSLEDIRAHEENLDISRPWLLSCDEKAISSSEYNHTNMFWSDEVEKMVEELNKAGHSNAKVLGQTAKKGAVAFRLEMDRVLSHGAIKKINFSLADEKNINGIDIEKQRKYIYDIMQVYDLWFKKEDKKSRDTSGEEKVDEK